MSAVLDVSQPAHALFQMQPSPPLSPSPLGPSHNHARMYHNAVYYQHDGRSPAKVIQPLNTSIIYYPSVSFDDYGQVSLGNLAVDAFDSIDGVRGGCIAALMSMKKPELGGNAQLKIILSVNCKDETSHRRLLRIASDHIYRQSFVRTSRNLIDMYGLDGIDLDWGVPETQRDGTDMQTLLYDLRQALPSPTYMITVALPPNGWAIRHLNVRTSSDWVDLFNVMCFDFVPRNSRLTGHTSAMYPSHDQGMDYDKFPDCHTTLQGLEAQGVPMYKVLLGISGLGRIFYGATGPGQLHEPAGSRKSVVPFSQLPLKGSKPREDGTLGIAYCVDEDGKRFVSYDNALTVNIKATYVRQNGLAGMVLDQAGFDVPGMTGLLKSAYHAMYPPYRE